MNAPASIPAYPVEEASSIATAQFAHCPTCDTWLGNPYWNLSKSIAMHKRGTGHTVKLLKLRETSVANRNLSQAW